MTLRCLPEFDPTFSIDSVSVSLFPCPPDLLTSTSLFPCSLNFVQQLFPMFPFFVPFLRLLSGYSPHGMRTSGSGSDINQWKICGPDPQTRRSEARATCARRGWPHARALAGPLPERHCNNTLQLDCFRKCKATTETRKRGQAPSGKFGHLGSTIPSFIAVFRLVIQEPAKTGLQLHYEAKLSKTGETARKAVQKEMRFSWYGGSA